jgi:hypothetical protein
VWEAHTGLMSLSVCPFVRNTKTRRFLTWELKLGCPRGVFCQSSIPSEYLLLCARRKFGFNKKIRRHLLCNTHTVHEWAEGTFLHNTHSVTIFFWYDLRYNLSYLKPYLKLCKNSLGKPDFLSVFLHNLR